LSEAAAAPLSFTRTELLSFLPPGWKLPDEGSEGAWEAARGAWRGKVLDGVGMDWPLAVTAADAGRLGRLEALRAAFMALHRGRLGEGTRGLGRVKWRAA
jgi:hypothetical protein